MKKYIFCSLVLCIATCSSKKESKQHSEKLENVKEQTQKLEKKIPFEDELFEFLTQESFVKNSLIKKEVYRNSPLQNGSYSLWKEVHKFENSTNNKFWIKVVMYQYKSKEDAKNIANKLKRDRLSRDILFKRYSILLQDNDTLILVESGCSSPRDEWVNISNKIKKIRKPVLVCLCGGACEIF